MRNRGNVSSHNPLIRNRLKFVSFLILLFALLVLFPPSSDSHSPVFRPPNRPAYKPPAPPARTPVRGGLTSPGTPGTPGGGPATPSPGVPGAKTGKGMAKKTRTATVSYITWEYWWARNRFIYLEFPNLLDSTRLYPVSPTPTSGVNQALIDSLKARTISMLRPMLDVPSARQRRGALIGLARLDDQESYARILELLKDNNQTVRDSVVIALGILKNMEAKHNLFHMARGSDKARKDLEVAAVPNYLRAFAEISLALSRSSGTGALLKSIAQSRETPAEVRALALEGLGLLEEEDSVRFLIDFLDRPDNSRELMAAAVIALSRTKDPSAIPVLEKYLGSETRAICQSAALGLGFLGAPKDDRLVKVLYRTFSSASDEALRGFCLVSMGQIGGDAAVQYLDQVAMKGKRADIPWACLALGLALRGTDHQEYANHLIHHVNKQANRSSRGSAAVALGLIRSRAAIPHLVKLLQGGDDPVFRGYCALALGMINDIKAIEPLRSALDEDKSLHVKNRAVMGLALLNDRKSIPRLVEMLYTTNNDATQSFIALSLCFMADVRIIDMIHDAMVNKPMDDVTMLHCIHVVSKLLSGYVAPYLDPLARGSNFATEYPLVGYLLDFGV